MKTKKVLALALSAGLVVGGASTALAAEYNPNEIELTADDFFNNDLFTEDNSEIAEEDRDGTFYDPSDDDLEELDLYLDEDDKPIEGLFVSREDTDEPSLLSDGSELTREELVRNKEFASKKENQSDAEFNKELNKLANDQDASPRGRKRTELENAKERTKTVKIEIVKAQEELNNAHKAYNDYLPKLEEAIEKATAETIKSNEKEIAKLEKKLTNLKNSVKDFENSYYDLTNESMRTQYLAFKRMTDEIIEKDIPETEAKLEELRTPDYNSIPEYKEALRLEKNLNDAREILEGLEVRYAEREEAEVSLDKKIREYDDIAGLVSRHSRDDDYIKEGEGKYERAALRLNGDYKEGDDLVYWLSDDTKPSKVTFKELQDDPYAVGEAAMKELEPSFRPGKSEDKPNGGNGGIVVGPTDYTPVYVPTGGSTVTPAPSVDPTPAPVAPVEDESIKDLNEKIKNKNQEIETEMGNLDSTVAEESEETPKTPATPDKPKADEPAAPAAPAKAKTEASAPAKAHSNPQTGVVGLSSVVGTLAVSMAGIVATRKKDN